uniref:Integrase_H2C2 domain-containing protein n=1 Tax=Syphacia muris TaxID=451379 RepID=A0A0N5ATP8_9BILA
MSGRFGLQRSQDRLIYLPRKHPIVTLLIRKAYGVCGHFGKAYTLAEFRTHYCIDKSRSYVKQILKNCRKCNRLGSKQFTSPPMPENRMSTAAAFQNTTLDYASPFQIKETTGQRIKKWIYLFTCLATRAVHLEIVPDLSEKSFILAFKKFAARRGKPISCF